LSKFLFSSLFRKIEGGYCREFIEEKKRKEKKRRDEYELLS